MVSVYLAAVIGGIIYAILRQYFKMRIHLADAKYASEASKVENKNDEVNAISLKIHVIETRLDTIERIPKLD